MADGSGTGDELTLADVESFFSAYYRPDNAILAVAGDVSAAEGYTGMDVPALKSPGSLGLQRRRKRRVLKNRTRCLLKA